MPHAVRIPCGLRQRVRLLAIAAAFVGLVGCTRTNGSLATQEILLHLRVTDKFTFEVDRLVCAPGQPIRLRITNSIPPGGPDVAHNAVVLAAGTDVEAFGEAAINATPETHYLPSSFRRQVLVSTPLVHPGEEQELTFLAPTQPGRYPLVCSFPGHCVLGMRTELLVQ